MNTADLLRAVRANVDEWQTEADRVIDTARTHKRSLSTNESKRADELLDLIKQGRARERELSDQQIADNAAAATVQRLGLGGQGGRNYGDGVTSEPQIYRSGPGGQSYFKDLFLARQRGDRDAMDRLNRNDKMVAETRALSTGTGAGGEWVPPDWLTDAWVHYVRPGRVTANLSKQNPLPGGTDVINIPKMLTGTAVAPQTTQNTAVQVTDATTGSISAPVITVAGGQTVSMQLVEQSPLNIDDLILSDLAADYATKVNLQALSGTGTGGQAMGLLNIAGTNAVAFTNASPAVGGTGGLYAMLGQAVSAIHSTRFLPPDAIIMHPRRWAWIESRSDSSNRPLVTPLSQNPMNAAGIAADLRAEGQVGEMMGLPVFSDASIPTNVNTNQDVIIVARTSDLFLWESQPVAEAFQQTYAQQLSLFCRLHAYMAYQPGRYPTATSIISGTGLAVPVW